MNKALLIIDLQNDFLPQGALAVPSSDQVIPIINKLLDQFTLIVASKDWHPKDHASFASSQGKEPFEVFKGQVLWPDHCVQETKGSDFPKAFLSEKVERIFYKGNQKDVDSFSIFLDQNKNPASDIHTYLQEKGVDTLYIAGLATDYCVKESVLDACCLGYRVFVVIDGCKAVNVKEEDEQEAINQMQAKGASIIHSKELMSLAEN